MQFPFYPEEGIIYASWETKWDGACACANISVFSNDLSFNDVKRYGVMAQGDHHDAMAINGLINGPIL